MNITTRPYDDLAAMAVFRNLDVHDHLEAELVRGASTTHLGLFGDWRAMQPHHVLSLVAITAPNRGATPFAVLCLANTGQAGVAQAALLARNHALFRTPLRELVRAMARHLPIEARTRGIHRIEARCWAGHPTASRLLSALGFVPEADLYGFGADGRAVFRQFAWIDAAVCFATPQPVPNP